MADRYPKRTPQIGDTAFEVRDWQVHHPEHADRLVVKGVNLHARRGEIVGIAGLMGAGRTELAMSVFGRAYGRGISGEVRLHGRSVDVGTIGKAIAAGLAYVTEDRKHYGLVLEDDIQHNVTLANLSAVSSAAVIDRGREYRAADDYRQRLRIRCSSVFQEVVNLSGGNQQKVVLAKWLFADPEVLILDEPTRGIDVGAKFEIYTLMAELAAAGKCVVMISSEMPELLGLCDRIYVMNEGRMVGEFDRAEASQEGIMRCIVNARLPDGRGGSFPAGAQGRAPRRSYAGFLKRNVREYGMLMSLVVIMGLFQFLTDGTLLQPLNLTNLVLQNSYIVIMALGMLLVIVAGHIDLSVGSVVGFIGALAAVLMVQLGWHFVRRRSPAWSPAR
jgi:ABC-type multidrug transport system ATPase subunit